MFLLDQKGESGIFFVCYRQGQQSGEICHYSDNVSIMLEKKKGSYTVPLCFELYTQKKRKLQQKGARFDRVSFVEVELIATHT
jgi:hypothetical protein